MAVLVEKQWADTDEGYVEDTAIVASAILPSGKILLSPDVYSDQYAAASFKQAINFNYSIHNLLNKIKHIYYRYYPYLIHLLVLSSKSFENVLCYQ